LCSLSVQDSINTRHLKVRATYNLKNDCTAQATLFEILSMRNCAGLSREGLTEILIDYITQVYNIAFAYIPINATSRYTFPQAVLIMGRIKGNSTMVCIPIGTERHYRMTT
jgi:hypothetical protein